jgi:phosphoribosyl 1,2-cyclic phosphate phosphodiesterase
LIANDIEEKPLNVYLTDSGYKITEESLGKDFNSPRLKFHKIKPFEPFYIEDYKITPLKANHDIKADPVIYAIEHEGKAILYANDTGFLFDESLEYIKNLGIKFDFLSLDCTSMLIEKTRNGHMSLDVNVELVSRLKEIGVCNEKTVVYVNHFSHNGLATHEEFVEIAGKYGYGVSYDGLEVEI